MTKLQTLVNIGPKLDAQLQAVGIPDVETLRAVGVDEAVRRLEAAGHRDARHAEHAIQGALAGVRWITGKGIK
jgi:TfoX-like protein